MISKLVALLAVSLLLSSCGDSTGNFNLACGTAADCSKGQICPTVGPMQGRCTRLCMQDGDCTSLSSSNVVCDSNECVPAP